MEGRGNRRKEERDGMMEEKKGIGFKSMNVGGWKTDKDGRGGKRRREESVNKKDNRGE